MLHFWLMLTKATPLHFIGASLWSRHDDSHTCISNYSPSPCADTAPWLPDKSLGHSVGLRGGVGLHQQPPRCHLSLCHRDSNHWEFNKIIKSEREQWSPGVMQLSSDGVAQSAVLSLASRLTPVSTWRIAPPLLAVVHRHTSAFSFWNNSLKN